MVLFLFIILINSSFTDFYNENYLENSSNLNIYIINQNNYYIHNSFFIFFNSRSIYLSTSNINSVIEYCSFFNITSNTDSGSGIYFECSINGSCVLNCLCGVYCYNVGTHQTYWGQFAMIKTSEKLMNKGQYLSISYCSPKNDISQASINFWQGIINVNNINSSRNYCYIVGSLVIQYSTNSTEKFNNIVNNNVSYIVLIYFVSAEGKFMNSNVINNTCASNSRGIIETYITPLYEIFGCVFKNNKDSLVLFNPWSGQIHLIDSWVEDIFNTPAVSLFNCNNTKTIYNIEHFNTALCENEFPIFKYIFDSKIQRKKYRTDSIFLLAEIFLIK